MRPRKAFRRKVSRMRAEVAAGLVAEGGAEAVAGGDAAVDLLGGEVVDEADVGLTDPREAWPRLAHVLGHDPGEVGRAPEGRQAEVDGDAVAVDGDARR